MFCSECGTKVEAAFCTNCGTAVNNQPEGEEVTPDLVVISQILLYVEKNWSEDFGDYMDEIPEELRTAREIVSNPNGTIRSTALIALEAAFEEFISGGGFSPATRFESLEEFLEEMK